jgi:hypothetical protein
MAIFSNDLPPPKGRLVKHVQINEATTLMCMNIEVVNKDPYLYEVKIMVFNADETERVEYEMVLSKRQKDELRQMLNGVNG